MAVAPRLRQLRRDKTVFALVLNISRLHLEEEVCLSQPPRPVPDTELLRIQEATGQWITMATSYVMQKYRCQLPQAIQLLGELRIEFGKNIPVEEIRRIPLSVVLQVPAEAAVNA